ncbi:receptor-type tyrosine-protein phosphatase N2-like [Tropilaelaps mercedesae]|uniref:Receptor-type tyrosine-protein phosphatase N2-like n=1 Tax=Tropilaelaps mercedesae TaxID=418985 RepID=A0A1V9XNQ3_9ACAR|nr:receptor-type tyrosine-protein phosphatase N2-like [Tropilaelaps mercedesae]
MIVGTNSLVNLSLGCYRCFLVFLRISGDFLHRRLPLSPPTDGIFGLCRGPEDPPEWSSLSGKRASVRLLESELARLWSEGYRWPDEYTQCVVRQLLEGTRQEAAALYDPGYCAHALKLTLPAIVS